MNYRIPKMLRAEINRIAALKIADIHLKALRDTILIGYTYFLEPIEYIECCKTSVAGYDFLISGNGVKRRVAPLHPLVSKIFYKWNDIIQPIDFLMANDLISSLFPSVGRELPDFNDPRIRLEVVKEEGLTDEHMKILSSRSLPLHLDAVMNGRWDLPFGVSDEHKDTKRLEESKTALEEFFNNHPFFEHLRIRMQT